MTFNNKLKGLRNKEELTQIEFAEKIGASKGMVAQWEAGNNYPSVDILIKISIIFNVSLDGMLHDHLDIIPLSKTSPNSLEKEDVKMPEVNTEDVISLLKEIKSEQLKGFANLKNILQPEKTKKERLRDELEYAELVRKADELRVKLHTGELEIKNKHVVHKANK